MANTIFGDLNLRVVQALGGVADGTPAAGKYVLMPRAILVDLASGRTIYPKPFEIVLDGTGAGQIELPCNDDPDVDRSGWTYAVTEEIGGVPSRSYDVAVPMGDTPLILGLMPQVPASPGVVGPFTPTTPASPSDSDLLAYAFALGG